MQSCLMPDLFCHLQLREFYWQCHQVSFILPQTPNHVKVRTEAEQLLRSGCKAITRLLLLLKPHGYFYPVSPWLPKRTSHSSVGRWSPYRPELQLWPVSFLFIFNYAFNPLDDEFCTRADLSTAWAQSHRLTYTEKLTATPLPSIYPVFLPDAFSLLLCLSLTARKGNPLLNYFPSSHFPHPLRSFPHHQQPHPENQFAQEAGLFNSGWGDRHLRDPPPALHFALMPCSVWLLLQEQNQSFSLYWCN